MSKIVFLEAYNRRISDHNPNELELVRHSNEVWGKEAHTLAQGVCVQAYPNKHPDDQKAYSFGTKIKALASFGFYNRKMIIREVRWNVDMDGVEEREQGKFACIPVDWIEV